MAETRNLCAQIPVDLHAKVIEEKNALGQALSEYITNILKEHFEGGNKTMANSATAHLGRGVLHRLFDLPAWANIPGAGSEAESAPAASYGPKAPP